MILSGELDEMHARAKMYSSDWRDTLKLIDEVRTLGRQKETSLHELRNKIMLSGRHIDTNLISSQLPQYEPTSMGRYMIMLPEKVEEFRSAYAQLLHLVSLLTDIPPEALTVERVTQQIFDRIERY